MILAVDIGNTHIALGLFNKDKVLNEWRLTSAVTRTEDELWVLLNSFFSEKKTSPKKIKGIVVSSVVPRLTDAVAKMTNKHFHKKPLIVSGELSLGIKIAYDDPSTLGADRICNAVGAYEEFGGPAIVIDFGTATTYDVISSEGDFLGGVIAPGVENSAAELYRHTARLPSVALQFPDKIIGTSTIVSMQSGIMYGALDAMEGMVERIKQVIGKQSVVVATGGNAGLMAAMSNKIQYTEPSLVLKGARLIYHRVQQQKNVKL